MANFKYSSQTQVEFFLNEKSLTMLYVLNSHPNIFSGKFLKILNQENNYMRKSQFYRYINSLERYNLIQINPWKKRLNGFGHTYEIRPEGKEVLYFLSKYFEKRNM